MSSPTTPASRDSTSALSGSTTGSSTSDVWEWSSRRSSITAGYTSADLLRSRAESMPSSYLCDDDLLVADDEYDAATSSATSETETSECVLPSYHRGADDYRACKALQQMRRREAMQGLQGLKKRSGSDAARRNSNSKS